MNKRGFIESKIQVTDYRLGGAVSLKGEVLMPTGHGWADYLPPREDQSREGFEPYACVSYAISHAVETLIKKKFLTNVDLSARFLAFATGTEAAKGNDPTTVCIFLGKRGDVNDSDWPYPTPASDFYKVPPSNLYTLALEFPLHYAYDNQWVPATPAAMKDALTRSVLTVAGFAWAQNADGLYYWPDGAQADHYFVIYDFVDGVKWLAFDTYANEYKELVWNYPFIQVKEHSLTNQVIVPSFWNKFIQQLRSILGLDGGSFGAARSPQWPTTRKQHLKLEPLCQVCGTKGSLLKPNEVHHLQSFATQPILENDPKNLITGCRIHHQWFYHLGSWSSINENALEDAKVWRTKIARRPKWNGTEWVYPPLETTANPS